MRTLQYLDCLMPVDERRSRIAPLQILPKRLICQFDCASTNDSFQKDLSFTTPMSASTGPEIKPSVDMTREEWGQYLVNTHSLLYYVSRWH